MNIFQKIKYLFVKKKITKEEAMQAFTEAHKTFTSKTNVSARDLITLKNAVENLKTAGFTLDEVMEVAHNLVNKKKYSKEKNSNVINLH